MLLINMTLVSAFTAFVFRGSGTDFLDRAAKENTLVADAELIFTVFLYSYCSILMFGNDHFQRTENRK